MFSSTKQKFIIFFLIVLIVAFVDQWTKNLAWAAFDEQDTTVIPIFEGWFGFQQARNTGVAFSFLGDHPLKLTILTSLISVGICIYALYSSMTKMVLFCWAFVVGGAIGNIIDRFTGIFKSLSEDNEIDSRMIFVRDFIDVYWGQHHWPTFNIADSMICVGVAYLFFYSFFIEGKQIKKEIKEELPEASNPSE